MSTPTASPSSSAGGLLTAAELFENELETATRQNYARAANSFHEWWADNSQNYDPSDIFTRDAGTNTYIMSKPAAWVALCEKKKGNPLIDYAAAVIPGYRAKDEQGMAHVRAVRAALHGVLKDADGSYTTRAIQRLKAGFRGARKANDKWMMENGLDDNAKDSVPLPVYEALAKQDLGIEKKDLDALLLEVSRAPGFHIPLSFIDVVFREFDADKSGFVDSKEIHEMAVSLGMIFDPAELERMIKEADTDGNGEIDFDEFSSILKKTMASDVVGAGFGALALRKKNSGPKMKWRTDKFGPQITTDGDKVMRAGGGDTPSVQLCDVFLSATGVNTASILIECTDIAEGSCIGVVSSNYQGSDWDTSFTDGKSASKKAAGVASNGNVYCKGQNLAPITKLSPVKKGYFISMDCDMQTLELSITVLNEKQVRQSNVTVSDIPVEVCFAVMFNKAEAEQSIRVVGSSSEKTEKKRARRTSKELWDDDNTVSLGGEINSSSASAIAGTLEQ